MAKRDPQVENLVRRVLTDFEADSKAWDDHREQFTARYRSYRGVLENAEEAVSEITGAKLQHPAVVLSSIESMTANLLDASPRWKIKARPVIATAQESERLRLGAEANELLLNYQLGCDHWAEKQRPFNLQALICGITGSKQRWDYREGDVRLQETYHDPVMDDYGYPTGLSIPRLRDAVKKNMVLRDDPTSEVIDMFDFVPHRSAKSLETADRVHHVVWYTKMQLLEMEANGRYGINAGGEPVSRLDDETGPQPKNNYRGDIFERTRPDDLIRCVEAWIERGRRVVTIAGSDTLIEDRMNPYWFDYLEHRFPFVICSGMPDPFRIPGISEVELMAELQSMLWTLMNTRLDATMLLAQPMFLVADDVEDPEALSDFGPGEVKLVPRPVEETIKQWTPDAQVPQMTIQSESMIRGDLQDVVGGLPYGSSIESSITNRQTATGVSILVSLAQKRLAAKKQEFIWASRRIGEQWCALNQQYVKEERMVPVIGLEGAEDWKAISPEMLRGVYVFETELADDSMIRQERRAESQAKLQVAIQAAPVQAQIGQPLNLRAFWDDYLHDFGVNIGDTDRYFSATPQTPSGQPQQPPAQQNGQGVTNPILAAGPTSPSNAQSMSPVMPMQRAGAMRGGPANGG